MFVCIVGTSRCGTTVLRQLLHQHQQLGLFNETHWLPTMIRLFGCRAVPAADILAVAENTTWDTGKDLFSVNAAFSPYESRDALVAALRLKLEQGGDITIQQFSEALAETCFGNSVRWGDKTPDYGYYMSDIQALWPECRFVHITRNGLATAHSMSRHPGIQLMIGAGHDNWCELAYDGRYQQYKPQPLPFEAYVQSWRRRIRKIRREADLLRPGSYLEVSYESLLSQAALVLSEVADFLGLGTSEQWLQACCAEIRNGRKLPEEDVSLYLRLEPVDLFELNRSHATDYFLLAPDASESACHDLLISAEDSQDQATATDTRIRAAISVMATALSHSRHDIRSRACKLLATSLIHKGEQYSAARWSGIADQADQQGQTGNSPRPMPGAAL